MLQFTLQFIEVVTSVKEVHSGNFCPFGTKARIVFPSTKRNCRRFDPALFLMTNLSPSSHPELLLTFKKIKQFESIFASNQVIILSLIYATLYN